MILSINEILDYIKCPMYYKYKYQDKAKTLQQNLLEKYDEDIHKSLYAYYSAINNDELVDASTIKRVWGSLWIGRKNKTDLLFTDTGTWRDTFNTKRHQGTNDLLEYHLQNKYSIGMPILINHSYEINIAKNLKITGSIELVREDIKGELELINFKPDSRHLTQESISKDLETSAMILAMKELFGDVDFKTSVYLIDKKKNLLLNKSNESLKQAKSSILNIARAIGSKVFYINPGEKCNSCIYRDICYK